MRILVINVSWLVQKYIPLLIISVGALTGCLAKPHLNKQTFSFGMPMVTAKTDVNVNRTLTIKTLHVVAPFDERSFIYRTGEYLYERDPYARFLEAPEQELVAPMQELLLISSDFGTVAEIGSAAKSANLIEITVNQLFGDFRQPEHPAAVLAIRFAFLDTTNGVPGKVVFQKMYSRNLPLSAPTAVALMAGWNEALTEITTQFSNDMRDSKIGSRSW